MSESSQPLETLQTEDTSSPQTQSLSIPSDIPPSFPQKRRGRPPGRPNTTVKESDYEDNSSVQRWNAAKIDNAIPAIAINIREALPESFLTRDAQQLIYRLPSREFIYFVQGWITSRQIASRRPSYVNGLLIHSRGEDSPKSCDQCAEKRCKNALGPFLTCRVLRGNFHNSCSNCKWFDTTSACSLYIGPKPNRKRKAKTGEGEARMLEDNMQELTQNGTLVSVEEHMEKATEITATQDENNGTDMSLLAPSGQASNGNATQEAGVHVPDGFDHGA